MPASLRFRLRRGTRAAWIAAASTPADGEPVWESDTRRLKVGTGSAAYAALPYLNVKSAADRLYAAVNCR